MRLNISLPDSIAREAQQYCKKSGRSLSGIIHVCLEREILDILAIWEKRTLTDIMPPFATFLVSRKGYLLQASHWEHRGICGLLFQCAYPARGIQAARPNNAGNPDWIRMTDVKKRMEAGFNMVDLSQIQLAADAAGSFAGDLWTFLLVVSPLLTLFIGYRQYMLEKQKREPDIIADLDYIGLGDPLALVTIQNHGEGTAKNVNARVWAEPHTDKSLDRSSHHPVLVHGGKKKYIFEHIRKLASKHERIIVEIEYETEVGKKRKKNQSFNLAEIIRWLDNAKQLYEDNPLETIARNIESVGKEIAKKGKK